MVNSSLPTGPGLWKAIAIVGIDENVIIGDFLDLTPNHSKRNMAMVLSDGTIVCNKDAEGGDLKALGCKGPNNYNEFWHAKNIYNLN